MRFDNAEVLTALPAEENEAFEILVTLEELPLNKPRAKIPAFCPTFAKSPFATPSPKFESSLTTGHA